MSKKKINREWHLYSALAITVTLTTISIVFFMGTPRDLGVSLTAIIGGFLFTSKEWKSQPIGVHKWTFVISCLALCLAMIGSAILICFNFFESEIKSIKKIIKIWITK